MAYNRPFDPDALPRFAEPEPKPGSAPAPLPSPSHQRYDSKPPPPVPTYSHAQQQPTYSHPQQQHPTYAHASPPPGPGRGPGSQSSHSRLQQQQSSRLPPSPAPDAGPGSDPTLLPLFRAVDKDGTGQLSERELSAALVNGDWTAFDIQTVRMMIRMFDSDRNGTINFDEFCGLWSFLASWRTLFDRFDVDRSGNISLSEFTDALIAFRYRLSPQFVELLFRTYDKRNEGVMSFDLFVQSCISLKRMTDVFKKYDDDRDGFITLSFEDFLSEILKQLK
ncbi:Programmed cell death protein 6 [Tolypocladium paradoxum]|uniref:Programmed cell death protein 6 n=1 Tax=Tolypocladium paradoxum TaxID=94208 RepID=A0A2S4KP87_9HYPO|nr:Programmed cell death protein 6 [Tolypocladium paradoxum]